MPSPAIWIILGVDLLVALVSVPMWLGWIPQNRLYGFRTPRTLTDEDVWYAANRITGRAMTLGALLGVALGFALAPIGNEVLSIAGSLLPLLVSIVSGLIATSAYIGDLDAGRIQPQASLPRESLPAGATGASKNTDSVQEER